MGEADAVADCIVNGEAADFGTAAALLGVEVAGEVFRGGGRKNSDTGAGATVGIVFAGAHTVISKAGVTGIEAEIHGENGEIRQIGRAGVFGAEGDGAVETDGIYGAVIEIRGGKGEGKAAGGGEFLESEFIRAVDGVFTAQIPHGGVRRVACAGIVIRRGAPEAYAGGAGDIFGSAVDEGDETALTFIEKDGKVFAADADAGVIAYDDCFFSGNSRDGRRKVYYILGESDFVAAGRPRGIGIKDGRGGENVFAGGVGQKYTYIYGSGFACRDGEKMFLRADESAVAGEGYYKFIGRGICKQILVADGKNAVGHGKFYIGIQRFRFAKLG